MEISRVTDNLKALLKLTISVMPNSLYISPNGSDSTGNGTAETNDSTSVVS